MANGSAPKLKFILATISRITIPAQRGETLSKEAEELTHLMAKGGTIEFLAKQEKTQFTVV